MQIQSAQFLAQFGTFKPVVDNEWTSNLSNPEGTLTTLELVLSSLLGVATVVGGILFLYTFIMGALSWVTAGGDSGKITKARDQMVQGAIGLIILVAAYAIIGLIGAIVGLDILNPAKVITDLLPQ